MKEAEKENKVETKENLIEKDWFLQSLVNLSNKGDATIGLTVITHGFLVSGDLVGGKEYFSGFGEDYTSGVKDDETKKSILKNFKDVGEKVYGSEKLDTMTDPSYIHIKGAKFFHPNGNPIPGNRGVWWRGRLSEISGFSLGKLNAE